MSEVVLTPVMEFEPACAIARMSLAASIERARASLGDFADRLRQRLAATRPGLDADSAVARLYGRDVSAQG